MLKRELEILDLPLTDAFIIKPKEFTDDRGTFYKLFNRELLGQRNVSSFFVEDYISVTKKGTIRALHYQLDPYSQAKLITCIAGEVFDVIVDLRKASKTFGKWTSVNLSSENMNSLYVPRGFAHGFIALADDSALLYQVDNDYSVPHERGIVWNDPILNIKWPQIGECVVSEKDSKWPSFEKADKFE